MANLKIITTEEITIDGEKKSSYFETSISGVSNISERTISVPTGSDTTLFSFSNTEGAGTFLTRSLKCARLSNLTTDVPFNLEVSSSTGKLDFFVDGGSSFTLSTTEISSSFSSSVNESGSISFFYDDISSIKINPQQTSSRLEYYIATN